MIEILATYPLADIVAIIVAFALSIKGVIVFFDWAKERLEKMFKKENEQEEQSQCFEHRFNKLEEALEKIIQHQENNYNTIQLLLDSDKDDIKSWITEKHHYHCYDVGWIDTYTMECLEKRFDHYQAEGGNSFIEGFMNDLRKLPKIPFSQQQKQQAEE